MAKTNKELAVELYSAFLISSGSILSNPNVKDKIQLPDNEEMIDQIRELTARLSVIQDD